jgi:hypoxanthine phosphoribosyltransferase
MSKRVLSPEVGPVLIDADTISARVAEIGAEITRDYEGRSLLCVGVLKGAFVFLADLVRAIDLPVEVDFMAVSSYGNSTRTSGVVRIVKDLDIVDSGLTLSYLRRNLLARHPASLEVCAAFARHNRQEPVKYVGFSIGDEFVIGYGLDAGERHRNLSDIRAFNAQTRA